MRRSELIEDEEFRRICPGRGAVPYGLPENTGRRGRNVPVIETWNHIILFDYDIYHYCKEHHVIYRIHEQFFNSRDEAIYFTAKHHYENPLIDQLHQRYCIGKCYNAMKVIMKKSYSGDAVSIFPELNQEIEDYSKKRARTALLASKVFNTCPGNASLYGSWAKALDLIAMKSPSTAEKIFDGDLHFSLDKTIALSKHSREDILLAEKYPEIVRETADRTHSWSCRFDFSDVKPKMSDENSAVDKKDNEKVEQPQQKQVNAQKVLPAIKQMPEYDPDAELNSLALTIPMWASSIERTVKHSDLPATSPESRRKLMEKLAVLKEAMQDIEDLMQEVDNE